MLAIKALADNAQVRFIDSILCRPQRVLGRRFAAHSAQARSAGGTLE